MIINTKKGGGSEPTYTITVWNSTQAEITVVDTNDRFSAEISAGESHTFASPMALSYFFNNLDVYLSTEVDYVHYRVVGNTFSVEYEKSSRP